MKNGFIIGQREYVDKRVKQNFIESKIFNKKINLYDLGEFSLIADAHKCVHNSEENIFVIGDIFNIQSITQNLGVLLDSSQNLAENVCKLLTNSHDSIIEKLFGDYTVIMKQHDGIKIYTNPHGINPVTFINGEGKKSYITNIYKFIHQLSDENQVSFKSEVDILDSADRNDNYTPFNNTLKLKPQSVFEFKISATGHFFYNAQHYPHQYSLQNYSEDKALELIHNNFSKYFEDLLRKKGSSAVIHIPLSGGLDSSIITVLASKYFDKVCTYSIGTKEANEFKYAKIVADAVQSDHHEIMLNDEMIVHGIIDAIYHNEIFDGLSAEIQSGLFNIYRYIQKHIDFNESHCLLTGYGSDLIFGGVLNYNENEQASLEHLRHQIFRTRWTSELSTHGAQFFNMDLYHPFWNIEMISFNEKFHHELKFKNNENKYILRKYLESLNSLPYDIIWRKKIGIHEGSSINDIFTRFFGLNPGNYQQKDVITYKIFKSLIRNPSLVNDGLIDYTRLINEVA